MKVLTIVGTRPEFIRLSIIIKKLDLHCEQILVHTGQNYDYELNQIFFKELNIRKPDIFLEAKGSFGAQLAIISKKFEKVIKKVKPDRLLVLGDTNSSLSAILAKRMGVPVFHMEAGNRCFDLKVPEEVNRKIIDHSSDILLPYTNRSCENLVNEGIPRRRIYITGNPIYEVLKTFEKQINNSKILKKMNLNRNKFFLLTLHREENVDNKNKLKEFIGVLNDIHAKFKYTIIWPVHPRTKKNLVNNNLLDPKNKALKIIKPLGFIDFVKLEKNSYCVLTDSGTVQEECSIFGIPNITLRETTERPETIESSSNMITSSNIEIILNAINISVKYSNNITIPEGYEVNNVSDKVCKILLSNYFRTYA